MLLIKKSEFLSLSDAEFIRLAKLPMKLRRIALALRRLKKVSSYEIAKETGISRSAACSHLLSLVRLGFAKKGAFPAKNSKGDHRWVVTFTYEEA